jgi:hypothetical protein
LSDPNAILKPPVLLPVAPVAAFVPSSFSSLLAEVQPSAAVTSEKPTVVKSRGAAAVIKLTTKSAVSGGVGGPPAAGNATWNLKTSAQTGPGSTDSLVTAVVGSSLSKKKAQASAAAAAAVKQMEQFCSVRM